MNFIINIIIEFFLLIFYYYYYYYYYNHHHHHHQPTRLGDSCDHHQFVPQKQYNQYTNNFKKCMIKPLGITLDLDVECSKYFDEGK